MTEKSWVAPSDLLEGFFQVACSKRVASFDVFDTALWRRVAQPTHIFALAEQDLVRTLGEEVARDFAQSRVDAELLARELGRREHGHVETTLDDIYYVLPRFWPRPVAVLAASREAELSAELANIEPEPGILDVYRRLKSCNVTTVFVSDMYLGERDVRALLLKCGYDRDDPLFVSSEYRKAKWDGSIWDVVTNVLGVTRSDIAHIGDNLYVDVEVAKRSGLAAYFWPGRTHHHKAGAPVSRWIAPLSALKAMGQTVSEPPERQRASWERLGRTYGTIIFGSFLRWIAGRVGNADHVYFCARDGQVLLRLWREIIEPYSAVPSASYLHVSRRALMLPRLDRLSTQAIGFLGSGSEPRTVRTYLDRVELLDRPKAVALAENMFGSLDTIIESSRDSQALQDLFRSLEQELADVARGSRALAEGYLEQEGLFAGGRRVLVDLGWRGSLQRSLAEFVRRRGASTSLSGLYYGLTREAGVNRGAAGWMDAMISNDFMDAERDFRLQQMITVLEPLHSADHGSVWGYAEENGRIRPRFHSNEVEKRQFKDQIRPLQESASRELQDIFAGMHGVTPEHLTPESAWAALTDLCLFPSLDEARLLGALRKMDGFEHAGNGIALSAPPPNPNFEEAERALDGPVWISGSFKNWIADRPDLALTVQSLARCQNLDPRWVRQFV